MQQKSLDLWSALSRMACNFWSRAASKVLSTMTSTSRQLVSRFTKIDQKTRPKQRWKIAWGPTETIMFMMEKVVISKKATKMTQVQGSTSMAFRATVGQPSKVITWNKVKEPGGDIQTFFGSEFFRDNALGNAIRSPSHLWHTSAHTHKYIYIQYIYIYTV